jgi:hypothetical protein
MGLHNGLIPKERHTRLTLLGRGMEAELTCAFCALKSDSILVFCLFYYRGVITRVYDEVVMSFRSSELRRPASRTNS